MEDAVMIIDLVASLVVKKILAAETEEESGEGMPLPFHMKSSIPIKHILLRG